MNRAKLIIAGLVGSFMLFVVACGAGLTPTAATPTPIAAITPAAPSPTSTPAPPTPTRDPAATIAPANGGMSPELVAAGKEIFTGKGICMTCHIIDGISAGPVGPDLTHIGTDAASRKPGMTARDYITESVKTPEAYVAPGVERAIPGLMTNAITAGLSDSEIEALVEFLLAQK